LTISRASHGLLVCAGLLCFAISGGRLRAQATPAGDVDALLDEAAAINDSGPEGIIPATHGFNASLGTTSQHDSTNGWSSILNPNLAYRFNKYFSVDASVPLFTYINV